MITMLLFIITAQNAIAQNNITVTMAGTGAASYSGDGSTGLYGAINGPTDVVVDAAGNIYFADNGNGCIRKVAAATGVITTIASGVDPYYMCIDASGNIYFSTTGAVKKLYLSSGLISTIAGTGTAGYSGDGGPANAAMIQGQLGICLDASGNLYIADGINNRVREVSATTGIINTIAGTGTSGYTGDGTAATTAQLGVPLHVCVNAAGDVYIADQGEGYTTGIIAYVTTNAMVIRKISGSTGIITTIAGALGSSGTPAGVLATDAWMGSITGMRLDASGNIYCCETSCSCREINVTNDSINYIGGNFYEDDYIDNINSLGAWMDEPHGLFVDAQQNVYVADYLNNRVRKLIQLTNTPSFAYGAGQTITACTGFATDISTQMAITNIIVGEQETWTVISGPVGGTLSGFPYTAHSKGFDSLTTVSGLSYTPAAGFTGLDSFKVMVSNGTVSSVITIYASVNLLTAGTVSGPAAVCTADSISLTSTVFGGTWAAVNSNATISSGMVTGVSAGLDTMIYTITSGSCVATTTAVVAVNTIPQAGDISGSSSVCQGSSITIADPSTGGSWSETTGVTAVTGSGLTSAIVTGITPGADVIQYTNSNACGSATATFTVIVNPLPDAGTISGINSVYAGASTSLSNTATDGIWSSSNTSIATVSVSGLVYGVSPGTASIIYTATNSCGTATASYSFTVWANTGINNTVAGIDKLTIMPNPAKENFTISVSSTFNEPTTITITNMIGEKVAEITGTTNQTIDASLHAPAGIYLINASTPHGNMGGKIVIE